jgi:hypothetical protein
MVVVADSCGHNNTYLIHEKYAEFVGSGDLHDRQYSSMEKRAVFVEFNPSTEIEHCRHTLHIFASDALRREYVTRKPILYATFIVALFFLTGVMFLVYDSLVARRQRQTEQTAQRATTIVKGLFPKEVAAQLYGSEDGAKCAENEDDTKMLCGEAVDSAGSDAVNTTIARLYPSATVLCTCNFKPNTVLYVCHVVTDPHVTSAVAPSVYSLGDHFPGF